MAVAHELLVEAEGLGKRYGRAWALRDLSLCVEAGSIYGLLGANGAGKTTTMRLLATLASPTTGRAHIAGADVAAQPARARRQLGYMPDSFGSYDDVTVAEYLDFFAVAHGVRRGERRRLIDDLLTIVGLEARRASAVDTLSRGLKQRLGIARCLVHDPPLLLLDEPASGLDPLARRELQTLLRTLVAMGKTVVISSHILPELGELCSHVGIVAGGRMVVEGSVAELTAAAAERAPLEVEVAEASAATTAATFLRGQPEVQGVAASGRPVLLHVAAPIGAEAALFRRLAATDLPVVRFGRATVTLQDLYAAHLAAAEAESL